MPNGLYRLYPLNCDKKDFIEHLTVKLDSALRSHPNAGIVIVGDFNKCPISSMVRNLSLKQIVKQPTRNDAILDLILTNMSEFCDPVHVTARVRRSDHNSVLCSLQNTSKGNQVTKVSVRRGRPGSKHAFSNWLTKVNWPELYQTEQCEVKLNIFQNIILSSLDCFLPRKIVKVHVKDKP